MINGLEQYIVKNLNERKKSSRLILSVFEPGDCIPWISSFERLGPYAVVFPPVNNTELVYKKNNHGLLNHFPRSYTETFLIWCRQNNFQVSFFIFNYRRNLSKFFFSRMISINLYVLQLNYLIKSTYFIE